MNNDPKLTEVYKKENTSFSIPNVLGNDPNKKSRYYPNKTVSFQDLVYDANGNPVLENNKLVVNPMINGGKSRKRRNKRSKSKKARSNKKRKTFRKKRVLYYFPLQ